MTYVINTQMLSLHTFTGSLGLGEAMEKGKKCFPSPSPPPNPESLPRRLHLKVNLRRNKLVTTLHHISVNLRQVKRKFTLFKCSHI